MEEENNIDEVPVKHSMLKIFFMKYGHGLIAFYYFVCILLYGATNYFLEPVIVLNGYFLDKYIPFCEIFVIPYFIWYVYLFGAFILFYIMSRKQFLIFCLYTFVGMMIAYMIYFVMPNGVGRQDEIYNGKPGLRPDYSTTEKIFDEEHGIGRDNILIRALGMIHNVDNPNNVWPSLHCYNAIVISIVLQKSRLFDKRKWVIISSWILTALICASTMFTKQHSILDMFGAILLAAAIYPVTYKLKWKFMEKEDASLKEIIRQKA